MKKLLKIFGLISVIIVLAIVAASVTLHLLLPPEKAKALVLRQLSDRLHREVDVGEVSVGVFSGLSLSNLKISEAPTFARGTFLTSDRFSVRIALLPLLKKEVVVKQVILGRPVINIVRYRDGKTFNFSDLMATSSAAPVANLLRPSAEPMVRAYSESRTAFQLIPEASAAPFPAAAAEPPPFKLLVSNAQIQSGVVHFRDESPAQQSVTIDPLSIRLRNVRLNGPFGVRLGAMAIAKGVKASLQLAGDVDLLSGSLNVKTCTLSSGGSTVNLAGFAKGLKTARPAMDLVLGIKEFNLASFAAFIALPPGLRLEGPLLGNAKVKGDAQSLDLNAQLDLTKMRVVYGADFSKPAQVPMGVALEGTLANRQDLALKAAKILLGSLEVRGHGRVQSVLTAQPQMDVHLETNQFPIDQVLPFFRALALPAGLTVKGQTQFAADISGTTLSCALALKADGGGMEIRWPATLAKPAGTPLQVAALGDWVGATRTLAAKSLQVILGPLQLRGSGTFQADAKTPRFTAAFKSDSIALAPLAKLLPALAPYQLSGTAVLDGRASGTMASPLVNGTLQLQGVSAKFQNADLTALQGPVTFTQQDVSATKLTGKLTGSDFQLKIVGHQLTTRPDITVEGSMNTLDLDKLFPLDAAVGAWGPGSGVGRLADILGDELRGAGRGLFVTCAFAAPAAPASLGPMHLAGKVQIGRIKHALYQAQNMNLQWNVREVTKDLSHVKGLINFKQGAGVLQDIERLAEMSSYVRAVLFPVITLQKLDRSGVLRGVGVPSLKTIPFDGIRGDYVLDNGIMDVRTFQLVGKDLDLDTKGTVGLAGEQPLDLHVTMKTAHSLLGGTLGNIMNDESGRAVLAFKIGGTVPHPVVIPDAREMGQRAVQEVGREILKNPPQDLKKILDIFK